MSESIWPVNFRIATRVEAKVSIYMPKKRSLTTKQYLFTLFVIGISLTSMGCTSSRIEKPVEVVAAAPETDWEQVTAAFTQLNYPNAERLFEPEPEPSSMETRAQQRLKIRHNRFQRYIAISKTRDNIKDVVEFYADRGLRLQPVVYEHQRVLVCCDPQITITLRAVENGTNITVEVPSALGQLPETMLADRPDRAKEH